MDRGGRAVVEWHHESYRGRCREIFIKVRLPGETDWGTADRLRRTGSVKLVQAGHRIALVNETCDRRLMVSRLHGSTWGPPIYLDLGEDYGFGPASINHHGDVIATSYGNAAMHSATLPAGSTEWSTLPAIPRENQSWPRYAMITNTGDVTLVTEEVATKTMVETLVDGVWQHEDIVIPDGLSNFPSDYVSEPGGMLALLFHANTGFGQDKGKILAFVRDRGAATFDAPVVLDEGAQECSGVSGAMSGLGDLVVSWSRPPKKYGGGVPVVARRASDGTWSAPQVLGGGSVLGDPWLTRSQDGRTIVVSGEISGPDTLFSCDADLQCVTLPSPPGIGSAYWRDYLAGPDGSVLGFGAERSGADHRYQDLRSTQYDAG